MFVTQMSQLVLLVHFGYGYTDTNLVSCQHPLWIKGFKPQKRIPAWGMFAWKEKGWVSEILIFYEPQKVIWEKNPTPCMLCRVRISQDVSGRVFNVHGNARFMLE